MRTLKFIVDDQILKQSPDCDFSGLVPGTSGYLKAEFSFSPEWNGAAKVAEFFSVMGKEFEPQLLKDGICEIPAEALVGRKFKIRVIGRRRTGAKLITNKVTVSQNGGKS